jgi:hypothetical protein
MNYTIFKLNLMEAHSKSNLGLLHACRTCTCGGEMQYRAKVKVLMESVGGVKEKN